MCMCMCVCVFACACVCMSKCMYNAYICVCIYVWYVHVLNVYCVNDMRTRPHSDAQVDDAPEGEENRDHFHSLEVEGPISNPLLHAPPIRTVA